MTTELIVYDSLPTLLDRMIYNQAAFFADRARHRYELATRTCESVLNILSQEHYSLVQELNAVTAQLDDLLSVSANSDSKIPASPSQFQLSYKDRIDAAMAKQVFWRLANRFHPDKPEGNKELFQRLVAAKGDLLMLSFLYWMHIEPIPTRVNTRKLLDLAAAFNTRVRYMMAKPEWKIVGAYQAKNYAFASNAYETLVKQAIVVQKQRISAAFAKGQKYV